MRMVFNSDEVATALGLTSDEFMASLPQLQSLGFPPAVPGLSGRWAMMKVHDWINNAADYVLEPGESTLVDTTNVVVLSSRRH
jgi:hypothetical protein